MSVALDEIEPIIGLDRVAISVVINPKYYEEKHQMKFRKAGWDMEYYMFFVHSGLYKSGRFTHPPSKYEKGCKGGKPVVQRHFLMHEGRLIMDVMTGNQYGRPFIKMGFNPAKLKNSDYDILRDEISGCLPLDDNFAKFVLQCELSRLELCIDLPKVDPDMYVVLHTGNHSHALVKETSEYNGTRNSRLCICKYDKRKELLEKHGIDVGYPLTRIELRVQERRASVADFIEMAEVDFYHKLFRFPSHKLQLGLPAIRASSAGKCCWGVWKRCADIADELLQVQQNFYSGIGCASLVQAISSLGSSARTVGAISFLPARTEIALMWKGVGGHVS